jgi:hypothetical protein
MCVPRDETGHNNRCWKVERGITIAQGYTMGSKNAFALAEMAMRFDGAGEIPDVTNRRFNPRQG